MELATIHGDTELNADGEWDLRALPYELAEGIDRAFGHTAGQREKPPRLDGNKTSSLQGIHRDIKVPDLADWGSNWP